MFCAFTVLCHVSTLKIYLTVFMSEFMSVIQKLQKYLAGMEVVSVYDKLHLIMCGATGMAYIQIMLRWCPYPSWPLDGTHALGMFCELPAVGRRCFLRFCLLCFMTDLYALMWNMFELENRGGLAVFHRLDMLLVFLHTSIIERPLWSLIFLFVLFRCYILNIDGVILLLHFLFNWTFLYSSAMPHSNSDAYNTI